VDEVLAVGDVSFQKRCLGKMKDASISGRTVIFVSHNLAAVSQLCSYALHLDKGASIEFDNAHKVVQSFIHNQRSNCIVRKWNEHTSAPGDNIIRLLSIKATQDNNPFDSFDINKDIIISFVYMMQQDTVNLITGISLYNSDGSCLFNSCDWRENKHSRGIYSKDVIIPSQILAEGPINVLAQMVFYDPDIPSVVLPDILQFEAIDSNHPESVRGKYKGKWPGLLRVKLEWKQPIRIDTNTTPHTH
jgi:lipopolysaccharide transport system ATP-binding protein